VKWYFAIDEAGGLGATGADAKTAVRSARLLGGLEPYLLYYGNRNEFTAWMESHGVKVIDTAPSFVETIQQAEAAGAYKAHSIGHWLRVAVPLVEQEQEFVLYTDCDVMFLKQVRWDLIRPKAFAAAPEFKPDNWNYFNAGVMVLNVPYMRSSYPAFEAHCINRINDPAWYQYDDEVALNEAYRGQWDRLDPRLNWKLYWGYNSTAAILHAHGPKLDVIEKINAGAWPADNPTQVQFSKMVDGRLDGYIAWLRELGDHLQASDMALALRMHNAASGLLRRKTALTGQVVDMGFMDFCMFG
jgi:hypothetical protein